MAKCNSVCRCIVQKDSEFFVAEVLMLNGTKRKPRFSPSPYDAHDFENEQEAHSVAERVQGHVRLFDALNGVFLT